MLDVAAAARTGEARGEDVRRFNLFPEPGLLRADAPFDVSGPTISHHLKGYAWRVVPTKEMGAGVEIAIGEDPDGSWLEFMLAPR